MAHSAASSPPRSLPARKPRGPIPGVAPVTPAPRHRTLSITPTHAVPSTGVHMFDHHLTIHPAAAHDGDILAGLALREQRPHLARPVLLAERDGIAIAALSLTSGRVATDASSATADAVRQLRYRRYQLQRQGGDLGPAWLLLRRPARSA